MLSDVVINISNGFEQTSSLVNKLFLNNDYDSIVKYGIEKHPQIIECNDRHIALYVIPTLIIYNLPCLIGKKKKIDLKLLNSDIKLLKECNIDVSRLLFIDESAVIEDTMLKNIKMSRLQKYINCQYSITNLFSWTKKYTNVCYLTSNGYYNYNADPYNNIEVSNTGVFSIVPTRSINNIIGFKDIIESHTCFEKKNIELLYNKVQGYRKGKTLLNNILINYDWINLDKIVDLIKFLGINILYITGKEMILNLDIISVYKNNKCYNFTTITECIEFINKKLKQETYISEVYVI